jgi:tetratricopeptide (TPR) repeat protein
MLHSIPNRLLYVFVCLLLLTAVMAAGTPKPDAKKHLDLGQKAEQQKDHEQAIKEFRLAIEMDPDFVDAHRALQGSFQQRSVEKLRKENPGKELSGSQTRRAMAAGCDELRGIYREWSKQFPKAAAIPWMLGELTRQSDLAQAEQFYLKALQVNPQYALAYTGLGMLAHLRGDNAAERRYWKQAYDCDPKNTMAVISYFGAVKGDRPEMRRFVEEVVAKSPDEAIGQMVLDFMASEADNRDERIAIYERSYKLYPPSKGKDFRRSGSELYREYLFTDPVKAVAIAQERLKYAGQDAGTRKGLEGELKFAQGLAQVRGLIESEKFTEALAGIEKIKVLPDDSDAPLELLRARATQGASGDGAAYDLLLQKLVNSKNLDPDVYAAALQYAAKAGKSNQQASADLWKLRFAKAEPMKDFELAGFDGKLVKLSALRSKVVLVDFFGPL